MKTAFAPIENQDSRILILGTMPGERSLKLQQYYGHAGNQFWKIMFALFNQSFTIDYEARTTLLLKNGIALWDVLKYCEGKGSSDTNIKREIPNDFSSFYTLHPKIKFVFLTSKKAEKFYDQYVGKTHDREYHLLPSPSSANTWKTFDEKLQEWGAILKK